VHVRGRGEEAPCVVADVSIVSGTIVVRDLRGHRTFHVRDGERFTVEGLRVEVRAGRDAHLVPSEPRMSAWTALQSKGNILKSDDAKLVLDIKRMRARLEALIRKLSGFVRRRL
jgi:hypothetical protein